MLRVRGVAGEVTVRHSGGPANDADIAREANEVLARAVGIPDSVRAVVHDQLITLSGPVTWHYQREAAERAVRYLKGVTGVFNAVTIKPAVSAADLKTAISVALVRNAQLEGRHITVTADADVVTLDGTVHSSSERRQADITAWSAPGVTRVKNHLRIVN